VPLPVSGPGRTLNGDFPSRRRRRPVRGAADRPRGAQVEAEVRADMAAMQLRLIRWNVGTLITFSAVLIAAVRL